MKCEETGYLEGMLAASMSQSGKLGFIGPVQGASLVKIMNAYEDGAKEVNPRSRFRPRGPVPSPIPPWLRKRPPR